MSKYSELAERAADRAENIRRHNGVAPTAELLEDCAVALHKAVKLEDRVAELEAERASIANLAMDARYWKAESIAANKRIVELEAERDKYREAFSAETETRQNIEAELKAALADK